MHTTWQTFLQDQGATLGEQGQVISWGQPELERVMVKHGPVRASLAHQGLIQVSGEDAFTFLQSQLTNDLNEVSDTHAQLSALCDPKGQLLAIFNVFKHHQAWYLQLDASLVEPILKRLNMYKLRSQVELTDVSDQWIQIGFAGEFADLALQRALDTKIKTLFEVQPLALDSTDQTTDSQAPCLGIKLPGPYHRYLLVAPPEQAIDIWRALEGSGEATNDQDWQLLDVVSGQPSVNQTTSGQWIAQFLNLDKLDAINFRKGCFPGQEVIARLHFRGKVAKRMVRVHLSHADPMPEIGETIKVFDQNNKSFKLTLVNLAPDIEAGLVCLAVTTLKPLETAQAPLVDAQGHTATIEPLPYEVLSQD